MPRTRLCRPGGSFAPLILLASDAYRMSLTSVDLPDPLTPVTATKQPSGKATSMLRRLCSRAPSTTSSRPFCRGRRTVGTSICLRPDR